ncbi:MAG: hypothetical protein AB8C84_03640 [Oligoflexales bacterium]
MTQPASSRLRVGHLNLSPNSLNAQAVAIEQALSCLGEISLTELESFDDPKFYPLDLLIVKAEQIPHDELPRWLESFAERVRQQGKIWVPALVLSSCEFDVLQSFMPKARAMNWYFDIVSPQHLASIPIRVSNLLRMHDHLHELGRYEAQIQELQKQLQVVEEKLSEWTK